MKPISMYESDTHEVKQLDRRRSFVQLAVLMIVFGLGRPQNAVGQDWQIGNPPVKQPVPQYTPQYPLFETVNDDAVASGSSNVSPPTLVTPTDELRGQMKPPIQPPVVAAPIPARISQPLQAHQLPSQHDSHSDREPSIFRDRATYPVDPRKPCNVCTHPPSVRPLTKFNLPGLKGRPYQDREPGGCLCGQHGPPHFPEVSVNWNSPLSAIRDRNHASSAELRKLHCQPKKIVDVFDSFAEVGLIPYHRRDNGYCGPGSDPYGCLGESR